MARPPWNNFDFRPLLSQLIPNRSTFKINRWDRPQTPTGFAEIVSDDFPVLHSRGLCLFYSLSGNDKVIGTHEYAGEFQRAVC